MAYANTLNGHNKPGMGNRSVAAHIKSQHDGAGKNGNSVSGMVKPARTRAQPGEPLSALKTPRATRRPIGG